MAHIVDKGTANRLRWKVRYRTLDGKARSRAFATKAEALAFATSVEWERGAGSLVDPKRGRLTFEQWVDRWRSAPTDLRPSSVARDDSYLRHRVLPHFATFRLCDMTTREVQTWADTLSRGERPLAAASIHKATQVLSKVLGAAVRDGRLSPRHTGDGLPAPTRSQAESMTLDAIRCRAARRPG